jgi:hypothetical protein
MGVDIGDFLTPPKIRAWYENVGRGSRITSDVYARSLRLFCHQTKTTPDSLLHQKEPRLHALLLDFVTTEEKRGQAGSSTATHLKAVKSWLGFNGIRVNRPVKVRHAQETPTLADERTPTPEELRRIFLAATPKNRLSCALMAYSGVRPEVLGNYLGDDGLRVKDLPELNIEGTKVSFDRTPAMVVVRSNLSKAGHRYFTFLGEEGCGYLVDCLRRRAESGELLGPETDIIHPEAAQGTRRGANAFIRTTKVSDGMRVAIRRAGFPWRPYVLRAYFDTQLLLSESKGKVAHDYRVFWMGHKGSMEARYTTNKGRLPQSLVDDMREAYQRCEKFLTGQAPSERDVRLEVAHVLLESLGYSEKDLEGVDLTDVQQVRALTQKHFSQPPKKQALVQVDELPKYLDAGWTFVGNVGQDRVLLNPPTGATVGPASPMSPAGSGLAGNPALPH